MSEYPITKTFKPQDEHFDNFIELCEAIKERYTLGFRDACKQLKASRSWMNMYIRPFVPAVYLSNGIGAPSPNYHRIVFKKIGIDNPPTDQIFFDEKKFNTYVFSHIISCKKRAKKIPKYFLMNEDQRIKYVLDFEEKTLEEIQLEKSIMDNGIGYFKIREIRQERSKIWKEYVSENVLANLKIADETKRTDVPFLDVDLPELPISSWTAVHDVMDYGDSSEMIYRRIFEEGMIRVELNFPNPKYDKKAKKIYYIPDPDKNKIQKINKDFEETLDKMAIDAEAKYKLLNSDFLTVSEESWQIFNQKHKLL